MPSLRQFFPACVLLASACAASRPPDPLGQSYLPQRVDLGAWQPATLAPPTAHDSRAKPVPAPAPVVRTWPADWPSLLPFGNGSQAGLQDMAATVATDVEGDPFAGIPDEVEGESPSDEQGRALTPQEQLEAIDRVIGSGTGTERPEEVVEDDPFLGLDDVDDGPPIYDDGWQPLTPKEQLEIIDRIIGDGAGEGQGGAEPDDPRDAEDSPDVVIEVIDGPGVYEDDWRPLTEREQLELIDRVLQDGAAAPADDADDPRDAADDPPDAEDDPRDAEDDRDVDDPRDAGEEFDVPIEVREGPGVYEDDFRPLTAQEQLDLINKILLQGKNGEEIIPTEDLDLPSVPGGSSVADVDEEDPFAGIGEDMPDEEPLDEWMTLTAEQRQQAIEDALRDGEAEGDTLPTPTDERRALVNALLQGQGIEGFDQMTFEEKVAVLQERLGQAGENPFEGLFDDVAGADAANLTFEQRLKAIEDALGIRLDSAGGGPAVTGAEIGQGNAAFNAWLRDALQNRLAGVEGERDDDGLLVNNDLSIQSLNLIGAFLIQDAVVAQLHSFAAKLQAIQKLDQAQRLAMAKDLVDDAWALNDAYVNMIANTPNPYQNRNNPKARYDALMSRADKAQAQGRNAEADSLRAEAERSAYGVYLYRQKAFYSMLDQNPLLGIKRDTYAPFDEAFLFQEIFHEILNKTYDSQAERDQALLAIFDEFLQVGIDNTMQLAKTEKEKKELEDILGFGTTKYKVVQDKLLQGADALDQGFIKALIEGARGEAAIHTEIDESDELWARILIYSAVAGTSLILPGTSGVVFAVVFSGAEVAYEGVQLVRVELAAGEAEKLAVIGGFEHLSPMYEKMVDDQWSNFSLAVLFGLADVAVVAKVKKALAQRQAIRTYAEQGAKNLLPNGTPAQQKALADRIEQSLLKAPSGRDASRTAGRAADDPSSSGISSGDETLDLDPPSGAVSRSDDAADDFNPVGDLPDQPPAGVRQGAREGTLRLPENFDPLAEFGTDAPRVLFSEFAENAARRLIPDGTAAEQAELAQRIEQRLRQAQRGSDPAGQAGRQADELGEESDTLRDAVPQGDPLDDIVIDDPDFEPIDLGIPSVIRRNLQQQADDDYFQAVADQLAEQRALASRAGLDDQTIRDITGGLHPLVYARTAPESAIRAAQELALERLRRQGYEIVEFEQAGTYVYKGNTHTRWVIPDDEAARALWNEALQVRGMFVRALKDPAGLSPADVAYLQQRLAADPNYFQNLVRRGFGNIEEEDVFSPILNGKDAWQLRNAFRRATAPRPQAARLLTQQEYAALLARQSAGETLDLSNVPRPGIARVGEDGGIYIGQGAGRHDRARPDDLIDLFIRSDDPLPDGIEIQILEEGVSPELVRSANLLSARGPQSSNPTVVNGAIGDASSFRRVRVRARDAQVMMSDIQNEIAGLFEQLGARGVDTDALEASTRSMSPVERLEVLRNEARRVGLEGYGAAGVGLGAGGASSIDPGKDQAALGGPSGPGGDDAPLEVLVVSQGGSTGDVLDMYVFNRGKAPVRLEGQFALEPVDESELTPEARQRIEELRNAANGNGDVGMLPISWGDRPSMPFRMDVPAGLTHVTLEAYCLQFDEAAPTEGTVFRLASAAAQAAYAAPLEIMRAARQVRDAGELTPDSDPTDYYHSMTQWAIWADEKDLDEAGFIQSFIEHGRRNFEAAGREWTPEVEDLAREIAPRRWVDVTKILTRAEQN